jgi:hypothetical protein
MALMPEAAALSTFFVFEHLPLRKLHTEAELWFLKALSQQTACTGLCAITNLAEL